MSFKLVILGEFKTCEVKNWLNKIRPFRELKFQVWVNSYCSWDCAIHYKQNMLLSICCNIGLCVNFGLCAPKQPTLQENKNSRSGLTHLKLSPRNWSYYLCLMYAELMVKLYNAWRMDNSSNTFFVSHWKWLMWRRWRRYVLRSYLLCWELRIHPWHIL